MPDEPNAQPFADEARKLVSLAQDWAQKNIPEHSGPECQWCPLCQFAGILRGEHPELSERIAEAGSAVAGALRGLVEAIVKQAEGTGGQPRRPRPGPGRTAEPPPAGKPPRVQHIRLVDES